MTKYAPGRPGQQTEDGYYVSITDMLIGLLFLFIIMLMYFATQLNETTTKISRADETRAELILQVADYMQERGVDVSLDANGGVLRFPSQSLFAQASATPLVAGDRVFSLLADALYTYLPCYSFGLNIGADAPCKPTGHYVDAIFIEGHTDDVPVSPRRQDRGDAQDNWELSTARAANAYRRIVATRPELKDLYSADRNDPEARRLFAIAGYADQRPLSTEQDEKSRELNRRIDIRFVMAVPDPDALAPRIEGLDRPAENGAPIRVGQDLKFTIDQPTDAYLRHGWSWREHWGVWTVGQESEISLPLAEGDPGRKYQLDMQLVAYVPAGSRERSVSLMINDADAAAWSFEGPKNSYRVSVPLQEGQVGPGKELLLKFLVKNPVSPKSLGESGDDRQIGLGVSAIRLTERK